MTEGKTVMPNGIQFEGDLKLANPASPAEGGSHEGGDPAQKTESPVPKSELKPKKPAVFSFDALEQAVGAIEARQEEEAESAAYTASVRDFLAKLPDLSAKLIAAHYRQGGQGKFINQQILYRSDLKADPATQLHARAIYVRTLAVYGDENGAVPDFNTVMDLAVEELALFEMLAEKSKSDSGASEKKPKKGIYLIGERHYALPSNVAVSKELHEFVGFKVVPALNALFVHSRDKKRKGRETEEKNFMAGVTITTGQLFHGTPGVAPVDFPPRKYFDRRSQEEHTQAGGQATIRSDGQDVWAAGAARRSQKFVEKMQDLIQAERKARIALCDIPKPPPLQFTDKERRLPEELLRRMIWFHALLHAAWDQHECAQEARERATLSAEEWVFTTKPGTVFAQPPPTFHWEMQGKDGKKFTRHYSGLWCLVERSKEGELILAEFDPYAYGLLDACTGVVKQSGKNYAGVPQPLQSILRIWDSATRKAAESEMDPEKKQQIREWAEAAKEAEAARSKEGEKAQFDQELHQKFLASMTPEEREAYEADAGGDTGDDDSEGVNLNPSESVNESGVEAAASPSAE